MSDRLTIGVLSPLLGGYYFGGVLSGVAARLAESDGRVVALQTLDAGELHTTEHRFSYDVPPTAWDQVDGFIWVLDTMPAPLVAAILATGKPLVMIGTDSTGEPVPSVFTDNAGGIRLAVEHLASHGHTRIAYVGHADQSDMDERRAAYHDSVAALGLDVDPALSLVTPSFHEKSGADAARAALAAGYDATAVIGGTDYNALGFMKALQEHGYDVPGDQAVIGFDNTENATYSTPPMSAIAQDFVQLGTTAADLVLAMLAGESVPPVRHRVATRFVVRQSCGCAHPDTDATSVSLGEQAATQRADKLYLQQLLSTEHAISMQLLRTAAEGPHSLEWLERSGAEAGCLAIWTGDRSEHLVSAVGWFARDPEAARPSHQPLPVSRFPPRELLDLAATRSGNFLHVFPIRSGAIDWGLLAVIAPIEVKAVTSEETFNQWAALVTVSLGHAAVLESLRVSEERYAMAARAANDALWDWDLATGVMYYSDRWETMLGLAPGTIASTPDEWFGRVHPEDRGTLDQAVSAHLSAQTAALENEHRLLAVDGSYRWVVCRGLAVADGIAPTRIVGSLTDITERKQLQDQLRRDASYDSLTGLPNRALFHERLEIAIDRVRRVPGHVFAVLFLDVDSFKIVNDSLGHLAGDRLLMALAERLRDNLRPQDTASRFGGDEFAVLLTDVREVRDLPLIAARMQADLAAPVQLGGHEVVVSAAIGIAISDTGYATAEDVLRDADIAMYRAKALGKGNWAVFDISMRRTAVMRLQVEGELRQAVDRDELRLLYQPLVNLASGGLAGFEALLRWARPGAGIAAPNDFLATAEETGLIVPVGEWTFSESCRQIARWRAARPGHAFPPMSVNVSNRQFWDSGLLAALDRALSESGLTPESLSIEITEGVIMHNPDKAVRLLRELDSSGFRLHIDDFGTGYSSLEALHNFPIAALKIDRSFVSRLGIDTRSTELVRSIVTMGRNLGLDVIAEGIESAVQAAQLQAMGCAFGQGFYFSRPLDAAGAFDFWSHAAADDSGHGAPAESPVPRGR